MKRTLIGVILIIIAFIGIIGWELIGREAIVYTDALVLNQDVEGYQTITQDMLSIRKVYKPAEGVLTSDDIDKVVGKEAIQFIPRGAELFSKYFEDEELAVNPMKDFVFALDTNALTAYPKSIDRGDKVYFYSYDQRVATANVLAIKDSNGNDIDKKALAEEGEKASISSVEFKLNLSTLKVLSQMVSEKNPLVIAYN